MVIRLAVEPPCLWAGTHVGPVDETFSHRPLRADALLLQLPRPCNRVQRRALVNLIQTAMQLLRGDGLA